MFETIILPIITLLFGGGLATFITIKSTRRTADANADQAEVQTRVDEFHLLKEQIELNQQQNLDLTKTNLELTEHIKEKAKRYSEQTEVLRKAQTKLLAAEDEKIKLTAEIGDLKVQLAHKRCDTLSCPFRQPPNVHTPPRPDMTNEEYHIADEKKTATKAKTVKKKKNDCKEELQK